MSFESLNNSAIVFILRQIEAIKKIKGLPYLDFIFKLIDIKTVLKKIEESVQEKVDSLNKERNNLVLKYAKKGADEKPLIMYDKNGTGEYVGLERGINLEYDSGMDKILEAQKVLIRTIALSDEDKVRLEKSLIDKKILENKIIKEEFTGDMYEAIAYFIKE